MTKSQTLERRGLRYKNHLRSCWGIKAKLDDNSHREPTRVVVLLESAGVLLDLEQSSNPNPA